MALFTDFTVLIPILEEDSYGEWIIDIENDGTPEHPIQMPYFEYSEAVNKLINTLYSFCEEHPEYEQKNYGETLEKNGLAWDATIMTEADVSAADAKLIIALLTGAVRAERFCDGALLAFLKNGSVLRWLERLAELDNT